MLVLLPTIAAAYELRTTEAGDLVRWTAFPVDYGWAETGAPAPEGAEAAVHGAFSSWEGAAGTAIAFEVTSPGPDQVAGPDAFDQVWFEQDWPIDSDALATSDVWFDAAGEMVAFDIRIDADAPWATDGSGQAFDLQAAIAHEVGHVLGLLHSEHAEATMYATTRPGEDWRRALDDDDLAGAAELYEGALVAEGVPGAVEEPGVLGGSGCSTVPSVSAALPLLLLSLRRRR